MNIVRLYTCPYFMDGECALRSNDQLLDYWNADCLVEQTRNFRCPRNREYCRIDVDTDNWSGDALKLICTIVNGYRRNGNGNTGEVIDVIEQIVGRLDNMKDSSSEVLCVSRKWFEEKQEEARQEGREEAWDLARRIATVGYDCYTADEVDKVFGKGNILSLRTPVDELLAKDKKYQEEKKALHIGDEVEFGVRAIDSKKYRGYITDFVSPNTVRVLTKELGTIRVEPKDCTKTGKHNPDIEKVMASFEKGEKDD